MAELVGKAISELSEATTALPTDLMAISRSGESRKMQLKQLLTISGANYVQLPDGTMIQWGRVTGINFNNQFGNGGTITFPKPFISAATTYIVATGSQSDNINYIFKIGISALATTATWTMTTGVAVTIANRQFDWIAIGRWKA